MDKEIFPPKFLTSRVRHRIQSQYLLEFSKIQQTMPYLAEELLKDIPTLKKGDIVYLANDGGKNFGAIEEAQTLLRKMLVTPKDFTVDIFNELKKLSHHDRIKGKILVCGKRYALVKVNNFLIPVSTKNINTAFKKYPRHASFFVKEVNPVIPHLTIVEIRPNMEKTPIIESDLESPQVPETKYRLGKIEGKAGRLNTACNVYTALTGNIINDELYKKLIKQDLATIHKCLNLRVINAEHRLLSLLSTQSFSPMECFICKKKKYYSVGVVGFIDPWVQVINLSNKEPNQWVNKRLLQSYLTIPSALMPMVTQYGLERV
jgi:hypothetical protein